MRYFRLIFVVIFLGLVIYPFACMDRSGGHKVTGLPWQIEILPDGFTRVFGVVPGKSSLQEVVTILGDDYELAIVENKDNTSLEMYFGHYRAGLMTAKMVLASGVSDSVFLKWKQRAVKSEYMKSGVARKYSLAAEDIPAAMQSVIQTITFIPTVNLDEEIILKRFGETAEVVEKKPEFTHYLFAEKGLAIAISNDKKDILQYVVPEKFSKLRDPLLD
ncbi:MAG: hypothetical protein V3V50_02865 [Gammaproteobacteria bacterium]